MKLRLFTFLPYVFVILAILFLFIDSKLIAKLALLEFENKKNYIFFHSIITSIILVIMGACGFWIFQKASISGSEIEKFSYNFELLTNDYYKEVDKKDLLDKAFDTVLKELNDPYTTRISEKFIDMLEESPTGLMVSFYYNNDNDIFVSSITDGTKASKSNIQVDDKVISINGINLLR